MNSSIFPRFRSQPIHACSLTFHCRSRWNRKNRSSEPNLTLSPCTPAQARSRIAASSGLTLLPFVVEQTDPVIPPDGLLREWPRPDLGVASHLSYMLQWYSLAALAATLWLVLNWRRRLEGA